jgi:hypothetical protein
MNQRVLRGIHKAWQATNPHEKRLNRQEGDAMANLDTGEIAVPRFKKKVTTIKKRLLRKPKVTQHEVADNREVKNAFAHEAGHLIGRGRKFADKGYERRQIDVNNFKANGERLEEGWRVIRKHAHRNLREEREANRQAVKLIGQHGGTPEDIQKYKSDAKRWFRTYKKAAVRAADERDYGGLLWTPLTPYVTKKPTMKYYRELYKKFPYLRTNYLSVDNPLYDMSKFIALSTLLGAPIEFGSDWTRKEGQNKEGGLNEKGRKSYERENPGSDLKAPSKKVGNPRRKSFCARMKGMRQRQKPENNTGDDRLSKSLRAWNC